MTAPSLAKVWDILDKFWVCLNAPFLPAGTSPLLDSLPSRFLPRLWAHINAPFLPAAISAPADSSLQDGRPLRDQPISNSKHDHFELDPFARTVAHSIFRMPAPYGTVIAITGPWGAGKSSAINLCQHHLSQLNRQNLVPMRTSWFEILCDFFRCSGTKRPEPQSAQALEIVNFACWWFRGQEALTLAFFQSLYRALGKSDNPEIKKILAQFAANVLRTGAPLLGQLAGVTATATTGLFGRIASGATKKTVNWLADQIRQDPKSIEEIHTKLSAVLQDSKKRFLVVIDDIDRLSPDDALLIFRLVKSVGHLPNIIYLLAYDRQIAEKIVSQQFPSEGPHYLEKIVQATFEVPYPTPFHIRQKFKAEVEEICPAVNGEDERDYLDNFFYPNLCALIRTPRDIVRFVNVLSISWPAVTNEVDCTDFLAIEMFRLFHPTIHHVIRENKMMLIKEVGLSSGTRQQPGLYLNELFFGSTSITRRDGRKFLLRHMFPLLKEAWASDLEVRPSDAPNARPEHDPQKNRLICAPEYFDTYFRFSLGNDVISRKELDAFLEKAGNAAYVQSTLREAIKTPRREPLMPPGASHDDRVKSIDPIFQASRALLWLDQLILHADQLTLDQVKPFLLAVFEMAHEFNNDVIDDVVILNCVRLHNLLHKLVGRLDIAPNEQLTFMAQLFENTDLYFMTDFTYRFGVDSTLEQETRTLLLKRIRIAEKDGSLVAYSGLIGLLQCLNTECLSDVDQAINTTEFRQKLKSLAEKDSAMEKFLETSPFWRSGKN